MDIRTVLFLAHITFMQNLAIALPITRSVGFPCTEMVTGSGHLILDCVVSQGEYLDFRDIRQLTRARTTGEKFNVTITCDGGKMHLPWPFRAANVIALKVTGCVIEGLLSERSVAQMDPDELKHVFISDVVMEVSISQLYQATVDMANMTKEFDCGPSNVREHIYRNVQHSVLPPKDFFTEALLFEKILNGDIMKTILKHQATCEYPYLRYLEQSGSRSLSSVHFKLVQENKYPELKSYSVRNNTLGRIPDELRDLRLSFLPHLESLDLSQNNIRSLNFVVANGPRIRRRPVYIDMRHNNINTIDAELVHALGRASNVAIDLRNNPLACSCSLYLYGLYLTKLSQSDPSLNQLRDLTCLSQQGVSFSMLDDTFRRNVCVR